MVENHVRLAKFEDAGAIAYLHCASLPNDLLPSLGIRFLRKFYYPNLIKSENSIVLVYILEGQIKAFVIFSKNRSVGESFLKLAPTNFILTILIQSLLNFRILPLLVGFMLSKIELASAYDDINTCPELCFIATDPSIRGQGIGTNIVNIGLARLKDLNLNSCIVKTSSKMARNFYTSLGFVDIGKEFRGKRLLHILKIKH